MKRVNVKKKMTKTIFNIEFLNAKIHEMHGILDSCNYKNNSLCNNVMAMKSKKFSLLDEIKFIKFTDCNELNKNDAMIPKEAFWR